MTAITDLRKRILEAKDISFAKHTKRILTFEEQPDLYLKTSKMKWIELRFHIRLEREIFTGSLTDVCQRFNWEVDRSTISRWRRYIRRYIVK